MNLVPYPRKLTLTGGNAPPDVRIATSVSRATGHAQGYRLAIRPDLIEIIGDNEAGVFYAQQTLKQLKKAYGPAVGLPCCVIEDYPDFPNRGYMQDISRDKVPTMQTLFELIDLLAELKYNQVQLYTEHTFAYHGHEEVWREASPMTPDEIRAIDAYCKDRFIELVPNQNSFGHLERWLKHKSYEPLAEKPDGFDFPWGVHFPSGFSLNPLDPKSLELVEDLFDQLLPNFSSQQFNVGCDETFDLGLGKSKAECDARGKERVYLDFLLRIYDQVKKRGKRMQFWGDIILHKPQLIPELPKDMIALNWGYDIGHPFERETKAFADAGVPFYVCPGTSSWCSISGRTDNAIGNLKESAHWGRKNGAIGYLNTDWGDLGHLQYLPISYIGIVAGAAYSWCLESNKNLDLAAALDEHVLTPSLSRERAGVRVNPSIANGATSANSAGHLLCDFGNIYQLCKSPLANGTRLFWMLVGDEQRKKLYESLTRDELDQSEHQLNQISSRVDSLDVSQLIKDELRNACAMLLHACHRGRWKLGYEKLNPCALATEFRPIIAEHKRLWLARNRPGGLKDSAARLERVLAEYGH